MKSLNTAITSGAVAVFPATVLVAGNVYGVVLILVILLGLWQIITQPRQSFNVTKEEALFFFSLAAIMATVIVTSLVNHVEIARADRFMAPLLAIPAYIYFKRYPPAQGVIWFGLIAGSLVSAGVAFFQVFGAANLGRAGGSVNPIMYGDISLIMGAMSMASIGWMKSRHKILVLLPVIALVAGFAGSALSLSRGGWLAIPFIALFLVWHARKYLSLKAVFAVLLVFFVSLAGLYFSPGTGIEQRVDTAVKDTGLYFNSEDVDDPIRGKSVGIRFELWKAATLIFLENPITGAGWGNFKPGVNRLIDSGRINKVAGRYYHAHNQFFSALAKGGLIGFFAIVIIYLIPGSIFFKYLKSGGELKNIALAGCILVIGFVVFSMTEAILERARAINFYSFYLVILMSFLFGATWKKGVCKHR